MQQRMDLGRSSGADPLASLLMLHACVGAGNHLHKPHMSRTDATTCACTVAVRATCRQMPHESATRVAWIPAHLSAEETKTRVYKSHSVRDLHDNIQIRYCGAPSDPLKMDLTLLWMIMDRTHKLTPLAILKHALPFLLGRSNSVFSHYCLLCR